MSGRGKPRRVEKGRADGNSESEDAAIELSDMAGAGDPPINFSDDDMSDSSVIYENIDEKLGNSEDYDQYSPMPGPPAIMPTAAAGALVVPPPVVAPAHAGAPAQPQAPLPVPAGVIPVANAQAGNMGAVAAAPLAQPAAQQAVQQQAQQLVAHQGVNPGAAERSCLANHWKLISGITFLALGGGAAGLYLARNSIWPPEPTGVPAPTKPQPASLQKIDVSADFVAAGKPVSRVVIDLTDTALQTAALHGFDVSSFVFSKPDGNNNSDRRTSIHGVYKFDKTAKTLTFFPSVIFMGGEARVDFEVKNPDATSADKTLLGVVVLTYPRRPTVQDQLLDHSTDVTVPAAVNVITGKLVSSNVKGKAQAAKQGTDALNPASVTFTGFEILDPLDTTTSPVYSNMNQTMQVPNQGTWTADKAGVVTFTPETGFAGTPYPATYQVGDVKSRPSNVARVIIDAMLDTALQQIEAFAKTPDNTFWTAYENVLIKRTPPVDTMQWNEANALAEAYTRMHIERAEQAAAFAAVKNVPALTTATVNKAYTDWELGEFDAQGNQTRAPYDRQYLWDTYIVPIDDTLTGLTPGKLGTRFVRLSYLRRILARYIKDMS